MNQSSTGIHRTVLLGAYLSQYTNFIVSVMETVVVSKERQPIFGVIRHKQVPHKSGTNGRKTDTHTRKFCEVEVKVGSRMTDSLVVGMSQLKFQIISSR